MNGKIRICRALYTLLQWTWGLLQNAAALALFLALLIVRPGAKRFYFHGAAVTCWKAGYSLGLGMFIFMSEAELLRPIGSSVLVHEYGHTLQSVILGPLFLLVVGLPSLIWATSRRLNERRRREHRSYYSLFCEAGANRLGERVTHSRAPR